LQGSKWPAVGIRPEIEFKTDHAHNDQQGLLRPARREEDGHLGRNPQGFSQVGAAVPPRRHPGDKKAEEKFKEISEANDVLSDEKKRKVYDQVGFYSDQIDPAQAEAYARQQGSGGGSPVDFGGFDFSGFQSGPGQHPGQQAGAGSSSWGSFKDIFSGIFSGAQQPQQPRGPSPAPTSNTRPPWTSGPPSAAARRASRCTARRPAPPATGRPRPAARCSARSATEPAR